MPRELHVYAANILAFRAFASPLRAGVDENQGPAQTGRRATGCSWWWRMPKKQTYEIAGEVFVSKQAVKDKVSKLLGRLGTVSEEDEPFVLELLARHRNAQQKIGAGVQRIEVRRVKPYNTYGFYIVRVDGTGTDFSYKECLDPSTPMQRFTAACRTAILHQRNAVRDAAFAEYRLIKCLITGETISRETCHVDHAEPWTFDAIVASFVESHVIDVSTTPLSGGGDNETQQSFADERMTYAFCAFHKERASMRVVSKRANLSVLRRARL